MQWKPLYCSSDYLISDAGELYSLKTKKILKGGSCAKGYRIMNLYINGKSKAISMHLLVARTFLGNKTPDGMVVNHKDGNKLNNNVENLEWVTPSQNSLHSCHVLGNMMGENNYMARSIVGTHKKTGYQIKFKTIMEAGTEFCKVNGTTPRIAQTSIWRALSGLRQSAYGYTWQYADI